MPRAIKIQEITEKTVVTTLIAALIVVTAVLCLILMSAIMDVPIKLVLP